MKILSLDQSTKTGFAVFEDDEYNDDFLLVSYGLYRAKGNTFEEKIIDICNYFDILIHEEQIDLLLLEDVQAQTNTNTYGKLSRLVGALIELANINNIEYKIIHSSTWRKGLIIKGRDRKMLKQQSQQYILDKYGIEVQDDVADAICIGTYFLNKFKGSE